MLTVPTLLDWARICVADMSSVPRSWASLIVRSATWIVGGRRKMSSGVTTSSCSAPATVNGLNVDPGS